MMMMMITIIIYPAILTAVAVFRKPNTIPLCFSIDLVLKFLVVMAACTPTIHVFLGRPLFLLSPGIHSIINFGVLSSGILLTWPYHCSLFLSMMSMVCGSPFTPIISFVCTFFILSILYFLADLLSTSTSVDKILFISLVRICHTSAPYIKIFRIIV